VVANTLNTTNTGLRVTSTVEAGAAAGGRGRLYLAGKLLATDAQIAAADTQVEFELGGSTAAALQAVVPAGGALSVEVEDAAGNVSALSTTSSLSVDYSPPVVTVTLPAQVRLGETAAVVFSFNKPVGSLDATSLVVSGGTVGNLTGSGIQFTGIFTPSASSGSTAAVTAGAGFARDAAGNPSLRSDQAALRVEAAGAVSVTGVSSPNTDGAYRAGSVITVEVAFSNAVTVSGAPAIDLAVKPARQAAYVSGSGGKVLTFRYEVREGDAGEPLDYDGSSALRLNGGSIVNLSGSVASLVLPVPGAAGSLAAGRNIRVDTTSPLVLIRSDRSVLRAGETAAITFELSEASTDFTASDVRVTNGTLGGFSGSGRQYSAVVTPNAGLSGAVGITVEAGAFSDAAGNVSLPGALSLENVRFAWAATWGGSIRDEVMSTGVDRDGNVYLAGRFSGTSAFDPANPLAVTMAQGGTDAFVSKFDRAGKFLWSRSFGGVGADEIRAMAISPLGGVILTGSFSGRVDFDPGTGVSESVSSGASDIFVLSLSPSGAFGWVRTLGGAGSDSGRALALDGNGFILVGGTFEGQVDFDPGVGQRLLGSSGANDGFLMKFSPSGEFLWAHAIGSSGADDVRAVAADSAGNVYVGGQFSGTVDFDVGIGTKSLPSRGTSDGFVAKYGPSGELSWAVQFGRSGDASINALATGSGAVVVGGNYRGEVDVDPGVGERVLKSEGGVDGFVVKLDVAGGHVWSHGFGGVGEEALMSVAVDERGSVYAAGMFHGTLDLDPGSGEARYVAVEGGEEGFVVKLEGTAGGYVWSKVFGGAADDHVQSVAVDRVGDVYVGGYYAGVVDFDPGQGEAVFTSAGGLDAYVVKLTSAGTIRVDTQAPQVAGVSRRMPQEAGVTAKSVAYRVRFSREVSGVDAGDFTLNLSGGLTGEVQAVAAASASEYVVVVGNLTGSGTVRLDVKAAGTGITDLSGNALSGGYAQGETYTVTGATTQPEVG